MMKNKIKIGIMVLCLLVIPMAYADLKEDGYFDYIDVGYVDADTVITNDLGVTDDALFADGLTSNGNLHLNGDLYYNGQKVNLARCLKQQEFRRMSI